MKKVNKIIVIEVISSLFILLFVYTAVVKLVEHNTFEAALSRFPLIKAQADLVSWVFPIMEIFVVIFLFIPSIRKWGFIASFFLMFGFTGFIIYMIYFTPNLPCSCGGVIAQMTWRQHLLFNIFFTVLAAIGIQLTLKPKFFIAINRRS